MIYATDELQNPLPLKTMLCEGDMNNPVRRSDAFLYNWSFPLSTQHFMTGEGVCTPIGDTKKGKESENL